MGFKDEVKAFNDIVASFQKSEEKEFITDKDAARYSRVSYADHL